MMFNFVDDNEVRFLYPSLEDIEDSFDDAKDDPSTDYHFKSDLKSVFDWIEVAEEFGESPHEKVGETVAGSKIDFSGLTAAECLCQWHTDKSHKDALAGTYLLLDGYRLSRERNWRTTAVLCLEKLITLQKELRYGYESEINRLIRFLEDIALQEDGSWRGFGDLINILLANSDSLRKVVSQRAFVLCVIRANVLREEGSYVPERDVLETAIELGNLCNAELSGIEHRYAETYRLFADYQDSSVSEGSILQQGLDDEIVRRALSDDKKTQWKSDMNHAYKNGVSELRNSGVDLSEHLDFDLEEDLENFSARFSLLSYQYTSLVAFYWLLSTDEFVPEWGQELDGASIQDAVNTIGPSRTGHAVQLGPQEDSDNELNQLYLDGLSIHSTMAVNNFTNLLEKRQINEAHIYVILNGIPWLEPDDVWYLTKVVAATFDRRFAEAIHLGVARLENVLYRAMAHHEEDVDSLLESASGTRTLGSLLDIAEDHLGEDFCQYLKYMYAEPKGQLANGNIRNRVAHGQFDYYDDNGFYAFLIVFDILRVGVRCDPTPFRAAFGYPSKYTIMTLL